MKEFMCRHPFVTALIVLIVCGTTCSCVRMITNPESAKASPIQITLESDKGATKGA